MADSAIIASLLMGQKRRSDPIEGQRKYGENLLVQGASTAPVQSPLEGLARALQGGVGGYFAGQADRKDEEKATKTNTTLGRMLAAGTPEEMAAIAKEGGGDSDVLGPLMGQLITGNMDRYNKNAVATGAYTAAGGVVPGAPAAPGAAPPMGDAPPLPQGQPAPGGFANNLGNIRTTNLPWDGKGPPQNGFETFGTPQQGANAMFKNFGAYAQANPGITVAQAIAKWAPPNENNTDLYIRQVSEGTGINPGMPLTEVMKDPAVAAQLLDAVTRKEKGGLPQGVNADTFMNATTPGGGQPPQGQPGPLTINMTPGMPPQGQPQGSADGSMSQPQAAAQPQAPKQTQVSPAAAELSRQAQSAYQARDATRAAALQQKAQEAQAAYVGEIDKEQRGQQAKAPQQNIDNESKLRDDFNNLQPVKDYRKAATVFRSAVEAARQNSKASDLNMVYAFATIMDPGSVVRDQETNMVVATAGASDRIKGLVSGLAGNSTLGPDVKDKLLNEMGSRYEAYKVAHDNLAQTFTGIAHRSNANPENVITPFPEVPYTKKTSVVNAAGADMRKKYGLE